MQAVQAPVQDPILHFGEFRDSSARPPLRYASSGTILGPISVHCENKPSEESFCHHLMHSPTILPRSHWSCCGGKDRASTYCCKTPHPGKIRLHCCTKDSANEGRRCAHLDKNEKIINCSHWSCCGNSEKYSTSCLISDKSNVHVVKVLKVAALAQPSSATKESPGFRKIRHASVTFDPEVDSEFTDGEFDYDSELSIEEYNNGPVVWSPLIGQNPSNAPSATAYDGGPQEKLARDIQQLQSDIKSLYAFIHSENTTKEPKAIETARNMLELKLLELEAKFCEIDSMKIAESETTTHTISRFASRTPSTTKFAVNADDRAAVAKASNSRLQSIDDLDKKLVRSGFNVDLSKVRSKLLNLSAGEPVQSWNVTSTPNMCIKLPDICDDLPTTSKGFSSRLYAPSFGNSVSSISNEAARHKNSHQNSYQVKPFRKAPKETLLDSFPSASSAAGSHHSPRMEPIQSEILENLSSEYVIHDQLNSKISSSRSPIAFNSNTEQMTPRNFPRQAYMLLKASPNVSESGGVGMCL